MHRRPDRTRRNDRLVAAVALVVTGVVTWQASYSAFGVTTANQGNTWTSGRLALTATDGSGTDITASAVFDTGGLMPGSVIADRCITVVYGGSITAGSAVVVYATGPTGSPAVNGHQLSSFLSLRIDQWTGSTDTACGTFDNDHTATTLTSGASLTTFTTTRTNSSNGIGTGWTPAVADTTRSYRFRVAFPGSAVFPGGGSDSVDTDLMNMTATTAFTWQVQS
jgi:hypothetical protein